MGPLPHQVAQEYESLLVVCDDLDDALLATLLVNEQKGALRAGVVTTAGEPLDSVAKRLGATLIPRGMAPGTASSFPLVDGVIVRGDVAQLLGIGDEPLVELSIGGRNLSEVTERLAATLERLQG